MSRSRRPGGIYQRMITAYRHPDRVQGRALMTAVIDSVTHGVPTALTELVTLGRTLTKRAANVLAFFDLPGTSNGPTEAINSRLEHLRGSALGFRNLTHYNARSLLEAGGFRPRLHPHRMSRQSWSGRGGAIEAPPLPLLGCSDDEGPFRQVAGVRNRDPTRCPRHPARSLRPGLRRPSSPGLSGWWSSGSNRPTRPHPRERPEGTSSNQRPQATVLFHERALELRRVSSRLSRGRKRIEARLAHAQRRP